MVINFIHNGINLLASNETFSKRDTWRKGKVINKENEISEDWINLEIRKCEHDDKNDEETQIIRDKSNSN